MFVRMANGVRTARKTVHVKTARNVPITMAPATARKDGPGSIVTSELAPMACGEISVRIPACVILRTAKCVILGLESATVNLDGTARTVPDLARS